jgi:predicted CoA-binding protein
MKKKTLVLGASKKQNKYSNLAIRKLIGFGYDAVAYGLKSGEISGINIDTKLMTYNDIDTVTLYMNPKRQKEFYDYVISLKPKRVIFNPGTENPEFYSILRNNDINFEVACTLTLLATNQY